MHRLVVSYGQPQDPEAFDAYYRDVHGPLALQIPGLLRLTVGHAAPLVPGQESPYLVAELDFEDAQAMADGFATPEGRAAGSDIGNVATGGVTMALFDVREVPPS